LKSFATTFTASTVSIRFAPVRFETSMAIAGLPFSRVMVSASLKVERMVGEIACPHHRVRTRR
jgi:hypothetical protein